MFKVCIKKNLLFNRVLYFSGMKIQGQLNWGFLLDFSKQLLKHLKHESWILPPRSSPRLSSCSSLQTLIPQHLWTCLPTYGDPDVAACGAFKISSGSSGEAIFKTTQTCSFPTGLKHIPIQSFVRSVIQFQCSDSCIIVTWPVLISSHHELLCCYLRVINCKGTFQSSVIILQFSYLLTISGHSYKIWQEANLSK